MMVGVTWDLPTAFVIAASKPNGQLAQFMHTDNGIRLSVGTVLGEVANFFTFKYACSARGAKLEVKNLDYGLLAYVVRNGSFWVILIIRYSAIPPHCSASCSSILPILTHIPNAVATTVFSTVGIGALFMLCLSLAPISPTYDSLLDISRRRNIIPPETARPRIHRLCDAAFRQRFKFSFFRIYGD
jgi:hypothetical protein